MVVGDGYDLPAKWRKRIDSAESLYQSIVQKADNARFYAIKKANGDRLKTLKAALTDATKSGDFDAATDLKQLVALTEVGAGRPKPKNVVRLGEHEYAVIETKVTWHVAKRICEDMGGHLAIINTPAEGGLLLEFCKSIPIETWIGATDEVGEGTWEWVDGSPVTTMIHTDNFKEIQHYLIYNKALGTWDDGDGGARNAFLCEWEK